MPDIVAEFPMVGPTVGCALRTSSPVLASSMSTRKLVARSRGTAITLAAGGAAVTRPQNACSAMYHDGELGQARIHCFSPVARSSAVALSFACAKTVSLKISSGTGTP